MNSRLLFTIIINIVLTFCSENKKEVHREIYYTPDFKYKVDATFYKRSILIKIFTIKLIDGVGPAGALVKNVWEVAFGENATQPAEYKTYLESLGNRQLLEEELVDSTKVEVLQMSECPSFAITRISDVDLNHNGEHFRIFYDKKCALGTEFPTECLTFYSDATEITTNLNRLFGRQN